MNTETTPEADTTEGAASELNAGLGGEFAPDWVNYRIGFNDGIDQAMDEFSQLCKDYCAMNGAVFVGDVLHAIEPMRVLMKNLHNEEAVRGHIYGAEAEQITRPLREKIAILRDSAKDVLAWADGLEMEPYSFARLRAAIAVTETPNADVTGLAPGKDEK